MSRLAKVLAVIALAGLLVVGCSKEDPIETGLASLEEGDYEAAKEQFEIAIADEKDMGEAYRGIGIACWEQEDYVGAKEAFELAMENKVKKTATLYHFLGSCELKLENPKSALDYYSLGLSSKDCNEEMSQEMEFNTIVAYEQLGQWKNAKSKAKEYAEKYPDDERIKKELEFFKTQY